MTITVAIHALDTIREVKEKIQTTFGIPISRQFIILDNGEFLEDHLNVLNTRISNPSSRFLFSAQTNAQNLVSPPLTLWNRRQCSRLQPTLFRPLEVIMQPMLPTTPLVPMLPGHQVLSRPASTPVAQGPAITPILHSPEFAPVVHVPAMVQAPERSQAVEVPASTRVAPAPAPATERTLVCPMPPWKPVVVRMRPGSPVFPMQHIQSAPNTEKEASSVKVMVNLGKAIPIETEWDGATVLMLKQKILEYMKMCARDAGDDMEDLTVEGMVLQSHFTDAIFRDDMLLKHCFRSDYPEVDLLHETVCSSGY